MRDESIRLRREVARLGPRRRGARVPDGLREAIGAYARQEQARGVALHHIAAAVGVSHESVRRWADGQPEVRGEARALVPVVVRDLDVPDHGRLSVTAPGGYRVECATVEQAAHLLRLLA